MQVSKLKSATNFLLIAGFLMLFGMPFLLVRKPALTAPYRERALFAITTSVYMSVLVLIMATIIVLAWVVYRKQRENYTEARLENLRELVEGTMEDHARQNSESAETP